MINDLNLLKVFYTVSSCGSISKAADILFISQPAISQNIKNLENQIGFSLFIRQAKGVALTEEGKELYSICQNIFLNLKELDNKIDDIKNLDSGILRIGASDTICKYYLIDILKKFEKMYPKIRYRVLNCTTNESIEFLKNGSVDISFIHSPISNRHLNIRNCLTLHDYFVCSYQFDDSKIKTLKDLMNYRILLLESESHSRLSLDKTLLKYDITLKPKFELASLDLLIEFCKNNMGIICVSEEYIKKELEKKELKIIRIKESLDLRYISLVTYENNYISNAALKFMRLTLENDIT